MSEENFLKYLIDTLMMYQIATTFKKAVDNIDRTTIINGYHGDNKEISN